MTFDFKISDLTINQFKLKLEKLSHTDSDVDLQALYKLVAEDGRAGILASYNSFFKNYQKIQIEEKRIDQMYRYQQYLAKKFVDSQKTTTQADTHGDDIDSEEITILGLDEVGRGPLAGPLTVGGVILNSKSKILGLNDSKQVKPDKRRTLSEQIFKEAVFSGVFSIPPRYIDNLGMTECLRRAFKQVVSNAEKHVNKIDVVLLDGNPLGMDKREVNVVKGDSKCASIAAASIIAKVTRDSYMEKISNDYPQYNFAKNKGYGTAEHIEAIKKDGVTVVHRKSFCTSFLQMSMF